MDDRDSIDNALRALQMSRELTAKRELAAAARANRLVRCRDCGHECRYRDLGRPEYEKRTLAAIKGVEPGRCEPAEYVTACPDCGAEDPFELVPELGDEGCPNRPQ